MIAVVVATASRGGWPSVGLGALIFLAVASVAFIWWGPLCYLVRRREEYYDRVLRRSLLLDVRPRTVTLFGAGAVGLLALVFYLLVRHPLSAAMGGVIGALLPTLVLRFLKHRRLYRLQDQLVNGIQTLSSGVRAGLNLIQAMELVANAGLRPISEEFAHLLREYEHGMSIEQAMQNAAQRMESSNYRLLFSALLTHRERGGDLGQTLDRIADSIREIHRLEKRIETLTAPGRAQARAMAAMPAVIIAILYFIYPNGVRMLFTEDVGKMLLGMIIAFNVIGFLWIRRIVAIDV